MITVTEQAKQELALYKSDVQETVTVRFYIETEGGWSATMYYDLALDEPRADDEVIEAGDGILVVVDRASWFFVDEPMQIDYDPAERAYRIRAKSQVIPDRIQL